MLTLSALPTTSTSFPITAAIVIPTAPPTRLPVPLKAGELPMCCRGPRTGLPKQPARDRWRYLYPEDLLRLANAHDFAVAQGMEWGVFVTVLRTHLPGSAMGDLQDMQEHVFQALRRYCRTHRLMKPEFVWVRECQSRKLDHLHVLTTIPDAHHEAIEAVLMDGMGFSAGGVMAKPSGDPYKLVRYFAKQLDPNLVQFDGCDWYRLRDYIGLRERPCDLPLSGRRSGVSHGIGPKAQTAAGFDVMGSADDLRDFYAGKRDNQKTAKRRGWDARPPAMANSYDILEHAHRAATNDNEPEAARDAA